MAILAACGSSASTTTTTTTASETATASSETTTQAVEQAGETDSEEGATGDASETASELQLQHVSLGFVSAYVLVRGSEAAIVDTGVAMRAPATSIRSRRRSVSAR